MFFLHLYIWSLREKGEGGKVREERREGERGGREGKRGEREGERGGREGERGGEREEEG